VRAKVLHALRTSAADDSGVLALVASHEAGYHREGEVRERLELTEHRHRNVVRRLATLRGHVAPELRADMLDMLVSDGGPGAATVARRNGRQVEIAVDEVAANDSGDSFAALDTSSDGGDSGDGGDESDRDAA